MRTYSYIIPYLEAQCCQLKYELNCEHAGEYHVEIIQGVSIDRWLSLKLEKARRSGRDQLVTYINSGFRNQLLCHFINPIPNSDHVN